MHMVAKTTSALHASLFFFLTSVGSYKRGDDGCRMHTADSEAQLAANVMGNQHRPHIKRLEMQGSAEPSELNCRYNARTTKNIIDSRGAHSWLDANPEGEKQYHSDRCP
jgi:hypothetical protein